MKKTIGIMISLSVLLSIIGNMSVYAAAGDIDESQWAVMDENDFSLKATDTLISSKYWGAQAYVNTDYGYAYNGSGSTDGDHWLAMKNGVAEDFVVDFDLFYDDIRNSVNSSYSIYMGLAKDMTLPSGAVAYTYSDLWYTNLLSLSGTLQDDSGTPYSYITALATRKYNTVSVPAGEPSYLNMRITVIGDTSTIYAKWNTASTWKTLKTKTASPAGYSGEKWLYWTLGAKMGVDNFKVYQKTSRVINETFDYQTETWKNLLTLSKYSYSWNKTLEGGWLQIAHGDNQIAMKNSYSDYILQFDYRPNYGSNRRLIFKIGGYEFHMTNMDTGIGSAAGVSSGATITNEYSGYAFPNQTWVTFKAKKIGKAFWLYAKPADSDDAFALLYKGTFAEDRKSPFEFNVTGTSSTSGSAYMDNLKVWGMGDYIISEQSFDKANVVNGETVTVTASVIKNKDTAKYDSAALITALYKQEGGDWRFVDYATDNKALTVGTASSYANSITIPASGTYKLRSFIWYMGDLIHYCETKELTMQE